MKIKYCKYNFRPFDRFKKFCELFLGIKFENLPYDKELNPDGNFVEATIPDSMVNKCALLYTREDREAPDFQEVLRNSIRSKLEHASFLAEYITVHEADERLAIMEMHRKAQAYEAVAAGLQSKHQIHDMHCAMDNARCLRQAANIIDRTASNGG